MDSWKIMEWLDEAYPDSGPSIYLPGGAVPVDRGGEEYKLAVGKRDAGWKEFEGIVVPVYDQVFGLCESEYRYPDVTETSAADLELPAMMPPSRVQSRPSTSRRSTPRRRRTGPRRSGWERGGGSA